MPTIDSIEIPRPKNWQDFQGIVECYAILKWPDSNVVQYGRNGQGQNGVDIYIRDSNGDFIGIQCKRVTKLSFKSIEKEVQEAEGFKPVLKHYIIATTTGRDAKLQEKINLLSLERSKQGFFTVDIIFWEEITSMLKTDTKMLQQLYPEFFIPHIAGDSIHINTVSNAGSIVGKQLNIFPGRNISKTREKRYIEGTIGSNANQIAYIRHLINRYKEFKKADFQDKSHMKYSIIYEAIRRETGYKWDETPSELFEDLCGYLQKRIDDTRLGRIRKKSGQKNYSLYREFIFTRTKGRVSIE